MSNFRNLEFLIHLCADERVDVMRGTWFFCANSEPVEEGIATQIETEHFGEFGGQEITEETTSRKGPKPGDCTWSYEAATIPSLKRLFLVQGSQL